MADIPGIPNVSEENALKCISALKTRSEVREGEKPDNLGDRFLPYNDLLDLLASAYGFPKDPTKQVLYPRGATQIAAGAQAGEIWINSATEALTMGV